MPPNIQLANTTANYLMRFKIGNDLTATTWRG